jgi:hypothetical protein
MIKGDVKGKGERRREKKKEGKEGKAAGRKKKLHLKQWVFGCAVGRWFSLLSE